MSGGNPYDRRDLERYAASYPYDKQGRSVRQLALLNWFVFKSFVGLPKEVVRQYALSLYDSMPSSPKVPSK